MKGSRVASRIVIFVVLVVVFGIGVSFIILPSMQGAVSHVASNAPAAAKSATGSDLSAPDASAAAARAAAAAPAAPPGVASPAAPASDTQLASASGNDTKASTPKRE
jgi:flagellar basal body-associated protein FliL